MRFKFEDLFCLFMFIFAVKSEKKDTKLDKGERHMYLILGSILFSLTVIGSVFNIGGQSNYLFFGLAVILTALYVINHDLNKRHVKKELK